MTWQLTSTGLGYKAKPTCDELMEDDWEPFAVVHHGLGDLVYLRRHIAPDEASASELATDEREEGKPYDQRVRELEDGLDDALCLVSEAMGFTSAFLDPGAHAFYLRLSRERSRLTELILP